MITTYDNLTERLNDSVDFIEIKVLDKLVTVEGQYLGVFEIFGIKERIVNSMGEITKLRVPDFIMMEIHESQIGEIELLYNNRVDSITVVFKNGRTEKYVIPLVYHHFRVTSTGDLRIELGQRPCMCINEYNPRFLCDDKLFSMTESIIRKEFTPGYMFGKNKVWDTKNERYQILEEKKRQKEISLDMGNYIELINERTKYLKVLLKAIYKTQKNMNLEKLIALATLVDIEYQESLPEAYEYDKLCKKLDISQYTETTVEDKKISNLRIERIYDEIKNCMDLQEDENELLGNIYGLCIYEMIEKITSRYKKMSLKKLIEETDLKAAILDFNTFCYE